MRTYHTNFQNEVDRVASEPVQRLLIIDSEDDAVVARYATHAVSYESGSHEAHKGILEPFGVNWQGREEGGFFAIKAPSLTFFNGQSEYITLALYRSKRYKWRLQNGFLSFSFADDSAEWLTLGDFIYKNIDYGIDGIKCKISLRDETHIQNMEVPLTRIGDHYAMAIDDHKDEVLPAAYGALTHPEWAADDGCLYRLMVWVAEADVGDFWVGRSCTFYDGDDNVVMAAAVRRIHETLAVLEMELLTLNYAPDRSLLQRIDDTVIEQVEMWGVPMSQEAQSAAPTKVVQGLRLYQDRYVFSRFPARRVESVAFPSENLGLMRVPRFRSFNNPWLAVAASGQGSTLAADAFILKLKSSFLNVSRAPLPPGLIEIYDRLSGNREIAYFDSIVETTTETVERVSTNLGIRYKVKYRAYTVFWHVYWEDWKQNGAKFTGNGKRICGFKAELLNNDIGAHVVYRVYEEGSEWSSWGIDGDEVITPNDYAIDGIQIKLIMPPGYTHYGVKYDVYEKDGEGWIYACRDGETAGRAGEDTDGYLDDIRVFVVKKDQENVEQDQQTYHTVNLAMRGMFGTTLQVALFENIEVRQLSYLARVMNDSGHLQIDVEPISDKLYELDEMSTNDGWENTEYIIDGDDSTFGYAIVHSDTEQSPLLRINFVALSKNDTLEYGRTMRHQTTGGIFFITSSDDSSYIEGYMNGDPPEAGDVLELIAQDLEDEPDTTLLVDSIEETSGYKRLVLRSTDDEPLTNFDRLDFYAIMRGYPLSDPPPDAAPGLPTYGGGGGTIDERLPTTHDDLATVNVTDPANAYNDDFGSSALFTVDAANPEAVIGALSTFSPALYPTWANQVFVKVVFGVVQTAGPPDALDYEIYADYRLIVGGVVGSAVFTPTSEHLVGGNMTEYIDLTDIFIPEMGGGIGQYDLRVVLNPANGASYEVSVLDTRLVFSNISLNPSAHSGKLLLDVTTRVMPDGALRDVLPAFTFEVPLTATRAALSYDLSAALGSYASRLKPSELVFEIQSRTTDGLEGVLDAYQFAVLVVGADGDISEKMYCSGEFAYDTTFGDYTGQAQAVIERPADVSVHMLERLCGVAPSAINRLSFEELRGSNVLGFQVLAKIKAEELLSRIVVMCDGGAGVTLESGVFRAMQNEGELETTDSDLAESGLSLSDSPLSDLARAVEVEYGYSPIMDKGTLLEVDLSDTFEDSDQAKTYRPGFVLLTHDAATAHEYLDRIVEYYGSRKVVADISGSMNLLKCELWATLRIAPHQIFIDRQSLRMRSPADCVRIEGRYIRMWGMAFITVMREAANGTSDIELIREGGAGSASITVETEQ